jgi:STE24 endopeptidase
LNTLLRLNRISHRHHSHTLKLFGLQEIVSLVQFSLFTVLKADPRVMPSFGFLKEQPAFLSLLLFLFLFGPVSEALGFAFNALSRMFEYQADGFAVGLGWAGDLTQALLTLQKENKSNLNVDPWYSAWHFTHPPLVERLRAITAKEEARKGGKKGAAAEGKKRK